MKKNLKTYLYSKISKIKNNYDFLLDTFSFDGPEKDFFENYITHKICYYDALKNCYFFKFCVNDNWKFLYIYGATREECIEKARKQFNAGRVNLPFTLRSELIEQVKEIKHCIRFIEKNFNWNYLYGVD